MNPNINASLQTNVRSSTANLENQAPLAQDLPQNPISGDMESAPALSEASQRMEAQSLQTRSVPTTLLSECHKAGRDLDFLKALESLKAISNNSHFTRANKEQFNKSLISLFFKESGSQTCLVEYVYNENREKLIPLFEPYFTDLICTIFKNPISEGLSYKPEGTFLDLDSILEAFCKHLETVRDASTCLDKIKSYFCLHTVLSTYYEPLISDEDFPEYSKKRIAILGKIISYRNPDVKKTGNPGKVLSYFGDWASLGDLHTQCLDLQAPLYKYCKEDEKHVLKMQQEYACWLMTPFTLYKGKSKLLVLDIMIDDSQKARSINKFHQEGIVFNKEFPNNPKFVSILLSTHCEFFNTTQEFKKSICASARCEPSKARIHLLEKLERLGLKPENINTHHPILELALKLKDFELLRHLILEYKFNPYYISDTTGYAMKHFFENRDLRDILRAHYSFSKSECYKFENLWNEHIYPALTEQDQNKDEIRHSHKMLLINAAKFSDDSEHLFDSGRLRFYIDINAKDAAGKTALDYARENNNQNLVKLIEENKKLIEEKKRTETTIKLIVTLGANGSKDNYQGLIAFLHKKGSDHLSVIEKAYQAQNTRIIEVIESYLFNMSSHFGAYARTQAGMGVQFLDPKIVLAYLRDCFSKDPSKAAIKTSRYVVSYYSMHAYAGLSDEALNEAIHGLIALIPDVSEVDKFSQEILIELIEFITDMSIKTQICEDPTNKKIYYEITKKAYKNVAHWLLSPVRIKNQSQNIFIISFLNVLSVKAIDSQKDLEEIELNKKRLKLSLQKDFFNSLPFLENILSLCKQNLSGYRANAVSIFQKLRELGLHSDLLDKHGVEILRIIIQFQEFNLLKYLILEEGLKKFVFVNCLLNNSKEKQWSCAAYCRNPGEFSMPGGDYDPETGEAFHKLWINEIEPVLMKQYLDLPPHSLENPRVDLIAQGKREATPENINLQNQWGETPLIFAAKYGYDVAKLLTIAGIDIKIKDKFKKTALSYAELNKDERSERVIKDYREHQNKINQVFTAVNRLYQKKEANLTNQPVKKLSKRKIKKAEQRRLKQEAEEAKNAAKKNETAHTPIAQSSTQTATPPPITITIPELLEQEQNNNLPYPTKDKMAQGNKANPSEASFDNFVYQKPAQELSHRQKAKEQIAQTDKKPNAKKKRSLFSRTETKVSQIVTEAKTTIGEGLNTVKTVVDIVKNPAAAGKIIAQNALQRLATTKEVSKRVKAQEKPLIGYPDLLELLDLVQAQDTELHVESNIKNILEAIDTALNTRYKNPNIKFNLDDIETVLKFFYPDMTVSQHGSHRTFHFKGMTAITVATHKENEIFKKTLQDVQIRLREALLKKLGIKSYDMSGEDLNPSPTDSPPAETKDESSEEEDPYDN